MSLFKKRKRLATAPGGANFRGDIDDVHREDGLAVTPSDRLGPATIHHDTQNPARGAHRLTRLLVFLLALSAFANVTLLQILAALHPLRRDVPYYVYSAPSEDMILNIKPLRATVERARIIGEQGAVSYVKYRHEVVPDVDVMNHRWGRSCLNTNIRADDRLCAYMLKHSSRAVYANFVQENAEAVKKLIERRITRTLEITVAPIERAAGQYEVQFVLRDERFDAATGLPQTVRERQYKATVWIRFATEEVRRKERYLNPWGFRVWKYRLAEVQRTPAQKNTPKTPTSTSRSPKRKAT